MCKTTNVFITFLLKKFNGVLKIKTTRMYIHVTDMFYIYNLLPFLSFFEIMNVIYLQEFQIQINIQEEEFVVKIYYAYQYM